MRTAYLLKAALKTWRSSEWESVWLTSSAHHNDHCPCHNKDKHANIPKHSQTFPNIPKHSHKPWVETEITVSCMTSLTPPSLKSSLMWWLTFHSCDLCLGHKPKHTHTHTQTHTQFLFDWNVKPTQVHLNSDWPMCFQLNPIGTGRPPRTACLWFPKQRFCSIHKPHCSEIGPAPPGCRRRQ